MQLYGFSGRNAQQQSMAAFPSPDWSSLSTEHVGGSAMGPTPSIHSSYAPSVMSSPSLASAHQSSFDDSESTSLQECFDAATELFMHHAEGTSNANDSDDDIPLDAELLTAAAAAAAMAATAISLPNYQDPYAPTNFPPSFHAKEEMANVAGQHSVLEMAAFQAAVQSVQALRQQQQQQQQPVPSSSSSSPIGDASALSAIHRRIPPAAHGQVNRQTEASFRGPGYTPYPLNLPIGSHPAVAATNFQTNAAVASTPFAVPSTVCDAI